MKMQPLSIRTVLILTISCLTMLIAFLSFKETYQETTRIIKIQSLQNAASTSDKLFEVSANLSELRNITYFMLYSDQDMLNTLKPRLTESRKISDKTLEEAINSLSQYHFPGLFADIEATKVSLSKLNHLRTDIDHEMTLPVERRDKAKIESWYKQHTGLILQTHTVWIEFIKYFSNIDPIVALHFRFKHMLAILMEYGDRERSVIGRLIVENAAPTPEEQATLLEWHGATEMGWDRITTLSEQGNLSASVGPYIKDTESHFTNVHDMVKDMFYIPGAKYHTPYPIGIDLWLEISTQVSDSSEELKNAVLKETSAYLTHLVYKAKKGNSNQYCHYFIVIKPMFIQFLGH